MGAPAWHTLGLQLTGLLRCVAPHGLCVFCSSSFVSCAWVHFRFGRGEVIGGFMMGTFTLFSVLYEGVEAVQRMVDPHHSHSAVISMDEEQPWALSLVGVVLNGAAVAVFRQYRLQGLSLLGSAEDSFVGSGAGGYRKKGQGSAAGGAAATGRRRGRDDLLEGVFVLAVAELCGRLAAGCGGDGWGYSFVEDCAALLAAVLGGAFALPLTLRTARVLLQASPAGLQHRLSRALIEGGLLDGVVECRSPHFWEHTPGRYVGSFVVRLRQGADEQSVRLRDRHALRPPCMACVCVWLPLLHTNGMLLP
jgi:Co/Zn/Cd efflux system component